MNILIAKMIVKGNGLDQLNLPKDVQRRIERALVQSFQMGKECHDLNPDVQSKQTTPSNFTIH